MSISCLTNTRAVQVSCRTNDQKITIILFFNHFSDLIITRARVSIFETVCSKRQYTSYIFSYLKKQIRKALNCYAF